MGNTEDALMFHDIVEKLQHKQASTLEHPAYNQIDKKENLGIMPFVNWAIADTIGMPVDLISSGLGAAGLKIDEPVLGSEHLKRLMRKTGVTPGIDERPPENIMENVGTVIGEASTFMLPVGAALKGLSTSTKLVGNVANSIWQSMVKNPFLTMTSELTGSIGAGIGRGLSEESKSPALKTSAEIIGGVAGGIAPQVAINTPTLFMLRGGKQILKKLTMPFTEKGAKYRAGEFLKGKVAIPKGAAAKVTEKTISDMPPAVASGEKKLIELYKDFITANPTTEQEAVEKLSNSMIKLESEMRKMGYGSPGLLKEITEKRVMALNSRMDKRILSAVKKAGDSLADLPIAKRRAEESKIVRSEIEKVMAEDKKIVDDLWEKVPKEHPVPVDSTKDVYTNIKNDLSQAEIEDIPSVLKKSFIFKKDTTETTVKEMQGLRKKLLEKARIARKDGNWNKARIASEVSDAILEDIGISAGQPNNPAAASLQAAIFQSRNFKTRYESGIMGKILGYSKSGAPAIPPELTLDISLGRMAERGAVGIDDVLITNEAKAAAERYLSRSFTDYTLDIANGTVNPIKAERWIKNNEAILDSFPMLRQKMTDATDAQRLAAKTKVNMDIRKKNLANPKKSKAARFLNFADLDMEIDSIMKNPNQELMAKELSKQAAKDLSGDATNGMRSGFIDYMIKKSSKGPYNDMGEQVLSGNTLMGFLSKNEKVLNNFFTPEQMNRMRAVGKELSSIESLEKTKPSKTDLEINDFASNALKLFSRVGGAQLGRWVARMTGGGTVQTPGIFSEKFRAFATRLNRDRAAQLIQDAVLSDDPALIKSLLLPIDKPKTAKENLVVLNKNIDAWLGSTGKRVYDDMRGDDLSEGIEERKVLAQKPTKNENYIEVPAEYFDKRTVFDEPKKENIMFTPEGE
jgi:hypothetical protein